MHIPQKNLMFKTSDDDPVFLHYHSFPIISYVYRKRLKNTLSLLKQSYDNLLEIGYGSGIFLPELSKRAKHVIGLEVHGNEDFVEKMLKAESISNVILRPGSILAIPSEDHTFNCVVSISTLEHLVDLDKAMQEIRRVLKNNGEAILSFPVRNLITDTFYKTRGSQPREVHPSSHRDILRAAQKYFTVDRMINFPQLVSADIALYITIRCKLPTFN